jgi:hypothetical protein
MRICSKTRFEVVHCSTVQFTFLLELTFLSRFRSLHSHCSTVYLLIAVQYCLIAVQFYFQYGSFARQVACMLQDDLLSLLQLSLLSVCLTVLLSHCTKHHLIVAGLLDSE